MALRRLSTSSLTNPKWYRDGSAGLGPYTDFELIDETVLTTSAASVTFSNLGDYSTIYKHLQLRITARGNRGTYAQDSLRLYFNGDTTLTNYNLHELVGNGTGMVSSYGINNNYFIYVDGSQSPANAFGGAVVDILDAYSSNKFKTVRALCGHASPDAGGATGRRSALTSLLWRNTAAVSSLRIDALDSVLVAGSTIALFGIKGA